MPVGQHTDPAIKAEILSKVSDEGMRVVDAAAKHNVHSNISLVLQLNRLKKENEQLYNLLG